MLYSNPLGVGVAHHGDRQFRVLLQEVSDLGKRRLRCVPDRCLLGVKVDSIDPDGTFLLQVLRHGIGTERGLNPVGGIVFSSTIWRVVTGRSSISSNQRCRRL